MGREFSVEVLDKLVGQPAELEAALVELQRREMLREKAIRPQRTMLFKHALTQEAAYNSILLSRRRELHREVAEIFIQNAPEAISEIGRHLVEARQYSQAMPYLVQAGERAARAYATEEAIHHFRQALELKKAINEPGLLRRAYEGLGQTLTFANRTSEAMDVYLDMLAMSESTDDVPMKISALNKQAGITAIHMGQFQEAEALLSRADQLSERYQEKSGIPESALLRCQMCTAQADFENVVVTMDKVIAVGEELGTPKDVAMGFEHAATSLVYLADFDEAQRRAVQGLKIARDIGDREHEAMLIGYTLPLCHISRGEFDLAWASLAEGLEVATRIGASQPKILAAFLLAEIALWRGDYELALDYGQIALDEALPLEEAAPFLLVIVLGMLGTVYLEISEQFGDEIAEFHRHALRLLESPAGAMTGGFVWADLGHCALILGDIQIAQESFRQGLNYPNIFDRLERPRHLVGAALLAAQRGDLQEALRLAEEGRAYAETTKLGHLLPFTLLYLGRMLLSGGEFAVSLEIFEQAEELAGKMGMRPILWQVRAGAARALDAAGDEPGAERKRAEAQDLILDIAGQFGKQELRDAYLRSALGKIREKSKLS